MENLKLGRYRHFKGNFYEVIGVARHSETLEELVVYCSLDKKSKRKSLWVRPKKMFLEKINVNNKKVPRFEYIR